MRCYMSKVTCRGPGAACAGVGAQVEALGLAKLLFAVGQVALAQLVHVEASASRVRQARAAAERAAHEAHSRSLAAGIPAIRQEKNV